MFAPRLERKDALAFENPSALKLSILKSWFLSMGPRVYSFITPSGQNF